MKVSNVCKNGAPTRADIISSAAGSVASFPVLTSDRDTSSDGQDSDCQPENQPTAKELAAAKAARIRLGFENADPSDLAEAPAVRLPEGPEPDVVAAVDYVSAADVRPLDRPGDEAEALSSSLSTSNWVDACHALCVTQRLALHHADVLQPFLVAIVPLMLTHIRSLRSQLTKIAILCIGDVFAVYRGALLPLVDGVGPGTPAQSVVCQLLLKSVSNEKRFVTEAASHSLDVFVHSMEPVSVLRILVPYMEHKNPKVRGASAELAVKALQRFRAAVEDATPVVDFCKESLLARCAELLSDNTPRARQAARMCACLLKTCVGECAGGLGDDNGLENAPEPLADATRHGNVGGGAMSRWESFCRRNLSSTHAHALLKA